jgi:hypothetical protein
MSMTGRVDANIRIPKWLGFYAGLSGYAYNGAGSSKFGLRQDGQLTIKSHVINDANDRTLRNADDVEFKANLLQTNIGAFATVVQLSQVRHSLWLPSAQGDYYKFVENAGDPLSPTGSSELALKYKFSIEKDSRKIEATWHGRMFKKETEWLYANMSALGTSGSGGGASGSLSSAQTYTRTNFRESNFIDVKVGGTSVGNFGSAKLEIESGTAFTDNRGRELAKFVKVKGECIMGQSAAAELTGTLSECELDSTVQFLTPAGETWQFTDGAILFTPEHMHSDKEANIKLSFQGEIPISLITYPDAYTVAFGFTS